MMTRNRARTVLAELQDTAQTLEKPKNDPLLTQPQKPPARITKSTLDGFDKLSLSSGTERCNRADSDTDIDLTEMSESLVDISTSDEDDGDESYRSEDSSVDEREDRSGEENACDLQDITELVKGGDLKKLKVDSCRSYLRNHGLRLTGTKLVLIDRIKQHITLKEGAAQDYDRSTFTINCTGDVCMGDVVLFEQKVYEKYDVAARSAAPVGRRTVAGRIVKESYGAQRQQHTFTVEVLWSTGCRPLAPMKQLLVKGRNLYKMRTFRQRWVNEGDRQKSLDEKHERGAAARHVRSARQGRNSKGLIGAAQISERHAYGGQMHGVTSQSTQRQGTNASNGSFTSVWRQSQQLWSTHTQWAKPAILHPHIDHRSNWPPQSQIPVANFENAVEQTPWHNGPMQAPLHPGQGWGNGFPCPTRSYANLGSRQSHQLWSTHTQSGQPAILHPNINHRSNWPPQSQIPVSNNQNVVEQIPLGGPRQAPLHPGQRWGNGFPCPTRSCANISSRLCSSHLCDYCCRQRGCQCSYPRYR